jgi:hypothetical protein
VERRGRGEDAIYFGHEGNGCTDPARHRHCGGRWRGEISAGYDGAGRRIRRKVSRQTKAAVQNKLKDLHQRIDAGISRPAPSNYTVRRACEDWLAAGLPGRSPKTVRKNHDCLQPLLTVIGSRRLAELDADEVHDALAHQLEPSGVESRQKPQCCGKQLRRLASLPCG